MDSLVCASTETSSVNPQFLPMQRSCPRSHASAVRIPRRVHRRLILGLPPSCSRSLCHFRRLRRHLRDPLRHQRSGLLRLWPRRPGCHCRHCLLLVIGGLPSGHVRPPPWAVQWSSSGGSQPLLDIRHSCHVSEGRCVNTSELDWFVSSSNSGPLLISAHYQSLRFMITRDSDAILPLRYALPGGPLQDPRCLRRWISAG